MSEPPARPAHDGASRGGRTGDDPAPDPVRARRAAVARWVGLGKRIGYLGLLVAIVAFAVGFPTEFPAWTVTVAVIGLVVSCLTLPIAVVFGYGINAAEREDRAARR